METTVRPSSQISEEKNYSKRQKTKQNKQTKQKQKSNTHTHTQKPIVYGGESTSQLSEIEPDLVFRHTPDNVVRGKIAQQLNFSKTFT